MEHEEARRGFLKMGTAGLAVAGLATAATLSAEKAAAQARRTACCAPCSIAAS